MLSDEQERLLKEAHGRLVRAKEIDEVYRVVLETSRRLLSDTVVAVVRLDRPTASMQLLAVEGLGLALTRISEALGFDPTARASPLAAMSPAERSIYEHRSLSVIPEGIWGLMPGVAPRAACDLVQRLLRVERVYSIGFLVEERTLGGLFLLARSDLEPHQGFVELLVNQAAFVVQRLCIEEDLEESRSRLDSALYASDEGLWDWDIGRDRVFFDERYYRMAGYEPGDFPMAFSEWEKRVYPDELDGCRAEIQAYFQGKRRVFDVEFRFLRKDGTWMWLRGRGKVIKRERGRPLRMIGTHADISERKRAEEETRLLQVQLHQAQKMESVGRLAGGVAHDFNNMLSAILGYSDIGLASVAEGNPVRELLSEIRCAAERSAELTRQLLAFARKQTIVPRILDLNQTIERMLKMLARLIGEDIQLEWQPHAGLRPVKMDPSQVDQILANLCVNARDAIAGTGHIRIGTSVVHYDEAYARLHPGTLAGHFASISVSDDGCGITPEVRAHLFEPFFTTKEQGKGTGLGLATVYGIVNQNEGFLEVESEPGKGSTFRVCVPFVAASSPVRPSPEVVRPKARSGDETVLVVEDEPMLLGLTSRILAAKGYRVLASTDPEEALRLAAKAELDLLITDVVMPGMNGRELARRVVQVRPSVRLLFMSGYIADSSVQQEIIEAGHFFIQKPFSPEDLALLVRRILDGAPGTHSSSR